MFRGPTKTLTLIFLLGLSQTAGWAETAAQNSRVKILENTEKRIPLPVYGSVGTAQVQLRAVDVELQFSSKKIGRSTIFSIYAPETGLFWWTWWYYGWKDNREDHLSESQLTKENLLPIFSNSFSLYVSKEAIVSFSLVDPPPRIWMIESKKKFSSEAEAYTDAFSNIEANLADIEGKGDFPVEHKEVALRDRLSQDYFCRPFDAHCDGAKIAAIHIEGTSWQIYLKNYDQQPATLTLDKDFRLLDVQEFKNDKKTTERIP